MNESHLSSEQVAEIIAKMLDKKDEITGKLNTLKANINDGLEGSYVGQAKNSYINAVETVQKEISDAITKLVVELEDAISKQVQKYQEQDDLLRASTANVAGN